MKGRVTKELEQLKSLSLKIQEARRQKMLRSLREKGKLDRSFSTYTKSSKRLTLLPPDTETYEFISRGEKC